MGLRDRLRNLLGNALPEGMLTEAEAVERARSYAQANGLHFPEPIEIRVKAQAAANGQTEVRHVYSITLGSNIPMPVVEVDGHTGMVLRWHVPSR